MNGLRHGIWRWVAASAAILVLASLVAFWPPGLSWWASDPRAQGRIPTGQKTNPQRTSAARPTMAGTYALRYSQEFEAPSMTGSRDKATLLWQATWSVAATKADPSWLAVHAQTTQWEANEALTRASGLGEPQRAALQTPFALRIDAAGAVAEVRCASDVPAPACALLATVAHAGQFVEPAHDGAQWQVNETDLTGTFRADYRRIAGTRVTKTWHGNGVSRGQGDALGLTSQTDATFVLNGAHVQTLAYAQIGRMQPPADLEAAATEFRVVVGMERQADQPAGGLAALKPDALQRFDVAVAGQSRGAAPTVDLEAALTALESLDPRHGTNQRADVRAGLISALHADPQLVARVEARLQHTDLSEVAERTLLEALVGADTPAAQQSLVRLSTDPVVPDRLRDRALLASVHVQHPTKPFVATLLAATAAQPKRAAEIGVVLGAAARQLSVVDPARARDLVAQLMAQATAAKSAAGDDGRRRRGNLMTECNWLASLGNAGSPDALPFLLEALQDPRDDVRVSAAHALRFEDPAATTEAMELRMASDPAFGVRAALLHAARFQGPKARQTFVAKALMFDPSPAVRLEAAFTVATWATTAPGLRQVLAQALAQEQDPDVQEALRNHLTPGRIGQFQVTSAPQGTP